MLHRVVAAAFLRVFGVLFVRRERLVAVLICADVDVRPSAVRLFDVVGQRRAQRVRLVAEAALPRFGAGVDHFVSAQNRTVGELFEADGTLVRLLARVLAPMLCQVRFVDGLVAAVFALVDRDEIVVDRLAVLLDQMFEQHLVRRQNLAAEVTLEARIRRVAVQVVHQRRFELEPLATILALVHLLGRVTVHVLEQLVFSVELLVAFFTREALLAHCNCLNISLFNSKNSMNTKVETFKKWSVIFTLSDFDMPIMSPSRTSSANESGEA